MSSRRSFLKSAAGAAITLGGFSYARVAGANDRLSVGLIGCGSRMKGAIMPSVNNYAKANNLEITAVCDPWRLAREEAAAMCKDWFGRDPLQYVSYRELLEESGVDAVIIASPEHLHTTHMKAAAEAGKDMYCEKPLGKDFEALKAAYDAVKAKDLVVQAGTQLRSYPAMMGARQYFATGALGRISRIEQHRNASRPYWYGYLKEVKEEDVDWAEFLGDRPMRPFNSDLYSGWYGYREFSDGAIPSLGAHYIDLVHSITGVGFPRSVVAASNTYIWKDDYNFDNPDHVSAIWEYDEGFAVHYSTNFGNGSGSTFKIFGTNGVMDLQDWSKIYVSGEGAYDKTDLPKKAERVEDFPCPDHVENWIQCLRSRETPNASIDAGYQHAVAVIMAVRASDTGRRQIYDADAREIREG
ncbi:MAG: Gfo/Idh/MocA family oxidoreductase [Candidatus Hydrogenedentales bacterium]|jgi:predicted dehydrogenase